MTIKRKIKVNEARILIFLTSSDQTQRYLGQISSKLGIDYSNAVKMINNMLDKHWIKKILHSASKKTFYGLVYKCPEMEELVAAKNA